ncbi:transposase [Luteolibacter arcticus]|uniref:Transposase n=1 Tax=Luteolibacter arcticus TaxID=1581411 RepID=A0ABT3GLA1_9BACT|nr:transposase [Luteolibacter arcticus]MCW1924246.1 transposase [Luteolibacter arcticus]
MDLEAGLIRTDQLGRLRFSPAQHGLLLDAFDGSGQSASRFAAQHGIKYTTFANWVQQRRAGKGIRPGPDAAAAQAMPLLLAEVEHDDAGLPQAAGPCLEVLLPGGVRLLIGNPGQLPLAAALTL